MQCSVSHSSGVVKIPTVSGTQEGLSEWMWNPSYPLSSISVVNDHFGGGNSFFLISLNKYLMRSTLHLALFEELGL